MRAWDQADQVLMLRMHRGFFQSMGVQDSANFTRLMYLLSDQPDFVREAMHTYGEFAAALADRVLREVAVDAVVFSEPIAGHDRALISPAMHRDLVLPGYEPVLEVVRRHGVGIIIFRS